jgi:ribosome-binding protein aMBF1 (putative translation factor)
MWYTGELTGSGTFFQGKSERNAGTPYAFRVRTELRQALQWTQQELAEKLGMNQAAISKLEHQSDMYVSTLRRFVTALGGELHITAHFPQSRP